MFSSIDWLNGIVLGGGVYLANKLHEIRSEQNRQSAALERLERGLRDLFHIHNTVDDILRTVEKHELRSRPPEDPDNIPMEDRLDAILARRHIEGEAK